MTYGETNISQSELKHIFLWQDSAFLEIDSAVMGHLERGEPNQRHKKNRKLITFLDILSALYFPIGCTVRNSKKISKRMRVKKP